ncbi:M23 family metallopeptidase [Paenactinomyces guangxiensis]|uniref:Peptidoglycan DD-metalloendopeptidase family protein n=1 Tax=Paenactinomyces guangxiensis TaxID=1490290 RepID=A0A7W2A9X1_9BACL|nr:peptidoglycan DD-metalloendopeptidase family protein [Paenactinomyces guangxiensis]MBA4495333.1 peptidoglycan DD-metalloendopeptidase family protein [Paenactinomyces guangxiensis]MBH8592546.1 peptidoglycan DD-metalloendopeptidase family protein [Paenactinomyces guangxiensis]
MKKKLIVLTLATTIIFTGLPVQGAKAEDIREQFEKKREEKKKILEKMAKTNEIMAEQVKIMEEADAKIKQIEKEVQPTLVELRKREAKLEEVNKVFNRRFRNIYQKGQLNHMSSLLSSNSFDEFLAKFELIRIIVKQDYALLKQHQEAVEEVKKVKKKYDDQIAKQDKLVQQSKQAYNKLMEELKNSNAKLSEIHEFEELHEDELIEINLEEWRNGTLKFPYAGPLRRPANARETSGWGYRYHPIFGSRKMHDGVDYAGPVGTKIFAAADGVVVSSRASSGYGWLITIYHGNKNGKNVFTRYAHSYPSQVRVRVGEQVSAGEWITSIGNNGNSTGPHLHFEVRYGHGENPPSVNPKQWMK